MKRRIGQLSLAVLGIYRVLRGIGEFFVIDFHDPSSYEKDWGGPSLAGVLAVHVGPGLLALVASIVWLRHPRRANSKGIRS
jgi:hypothetical protein